MSYLEPPPMPAPVIVMKDVGGFVTDYQNQTAIYRASDREVRLHECRSACTLALSLPNVCVYPGSTLKFHLAYDPRNHQTNPEISQQLFDSYPAAVRARLGTLTRNYKVLSGSELIALGIRDCNEPKTNGPKIMVASAAASKPVLNNQQQPAPGKPILAGLMDKMLSVFGAGEAAGHDRAAVSPRPAGKPAPARVLLAEIPLPPARPVELAPAASAIAVQDPGQVPVQPAGEAAGQPASEPALAGTVQAAEVPLPPRRPADAMLFAAHRLANLALPRIITGAQPILPPDFSAYADMDR